MGGADPLGGANLRCGHFSAKMYVKTKELGPIVGGGGQHVLAAPPLDPPLVSMLYLTVWMSTVIENK